MSVDTSWSIEDYRNEHESDEHWRLRKSFMEKWKHKFPEDELVCLARVFINVELLGCRYPNEVMLQIAELSKEVAADFRKNRQSKLKRTFVSASDAAQDRAKGVRRTASGYICPDSEQVRKEQTYPAIRSQYGDLILLDRTNGNSAANIASSCQSSKVSLKTDFTQNGDKIECEITINDIAVSKKSAPTKIESKAAAFDEAWKVLQGFCYTIIYKSIPEEERLGRIIPADDSEPVMEPAEIFNNTVASRMMKLMGWKGGALGAKSSGISEPITLKNEQMNRKGLGASADASISERVKKIIREYKMSDCLDYDLIFASDFSKAQREQLHKLARKIGLKSKSYSKDEDRYLTVSTSIAPVDLVPILLKKNCSTKKYELILPTSRKK